MDPSSSSTIHMKSNDRVQLLDALKELLEAEGLAQLPEDEGVSPSPGSVRVLVSPVRGEWVSLYMEDPERCRPLAALLTAKLEIPAIVVGRVGEVVVSYAAYDSHGHLADEYHSCPDYEKDALEDDATPEELARTGANVELLSAALGVSAEAVSSLQEVLESARIESLAKMDAYEQRADAQEVLRHLAGAFGLPDLFPDFDEMRHFVAEEEELDVVLMAFRAPAEKKRFGLF